MLFVLPSQNFKKFIAVQNNENIQKAEICEMFCFDNQE
jgi:hypothetical protein